MKNNRKNAQDNVDAGSNFQDIYIQYIDAITKSPDNYHTFPKIMVTAYVDLDQNEKTNKCASYVVPRYVTRRIRREALKTVATSNTPEKIRHLNTIIGKIDAIKKTSKKRAIVSKESGLSNENRKVEEVKSKFTSKVASMGDLVDSPLLGKKVVFKRNAIKKKRKHSEDSESPSTNSSKIVSRKTNNPRFDMFERQQNRSPKRRKKDFDVVFDTRYGMCMVQ